MRFRAATLLITIIISAGLNSCAYFSPLAEFSCGDYTCRLYGTVSVKQIKVTAGEKTIASFKTEGAAAGAPDYGFNFVDANFDGSYDICLAAFYGEEGTRYSFWLWDPVSKAFSTDKTLDSLLSPVFDSSTKTISAQYKKHTVEPTVGTEPETYIDEEGTVTYEWRQGALAAIKKECITYYSESEIYCVAVWDINAGGELEPTEEHWLMPDQYARAGYKPLG